MQLGKRSLIAWSQPTWHWQVRLHQLMELITEPTGHHSEHAKGSCGSKSSMPEVCLISALTSLGGIQLQCCPYTTGQQTTPE